MKKKKVSSPQKVDDLSGGAKRAGRTNAAKKPGTSAKEAKGTNAGNRLTAAEQRAYRQGSADGYKAGFVAGFDKGRLIEIAIVKPGNKK